MTNDELILKGVREVYKQNQEIMAFLKNAIGEQVPTSTHSYPPKGKDKPWEKGWSKDKEQNTNTDDTSKGFKL